MLVQHNCFESHLAAEGLFEWAEGLDPFFASSQQPPPSQFRLFYLVSALPYVALEETRLHSEEELLTLISNRQIGRKVCTSMWSAAKPKDLLSA